LAPFVACLALEAAVVAWAMAGCSDGDALVGGDCSPGYVACGGGCCAATTDASLDASGEGSADASGDAGGDSTRSEAATDVTTDATTDAADTGLPDAVFLDRGGLGDGSETDGTAGDGGSTGSDGSSPDAPVDAPETGPLCTPPLVDCSGVCVDTTSDPFNCGSCGNVCPSQICVMSVCQGSTAGGIVYIGHDYFNTPQGTAQARVLSNAVFIPQSNPLHVMSYERYASAAAVGKVKAILNGVATQLGRSLTITSTTVDTDIPSKLTLSSYQVLVVEDQSGAPPGALAALGASWASTLTTFTLAGGVVVVLDGGTGTGQMPQFSTATTLLSVTGQTSLKTGTPLDDVAPGDVVGVGVVSPYGAGKNSVSIVTEPNGGSVIYVVDLPSDASAGVPVVVHKLF
jgi:hypothetical protein